jgi:hypothetical protein
MQVELSFYGNRKKVGDGGYPLLYKVFMNFTSGRHGVLGARMHAFVP